MCPIFFRIGIAAHVYLIRNVFFISDNIIKRWLMAFSKWWTTSVGVQSPSYIITSSDFGFVETSVGTQLSISQLHHHIIGPSTRLWFCQEHPDKIRLGLVSVLGNIDNVWRCSCLQTPHQFTLFRTAQFGLNLLFTSLVVLIVWFCVVFRHAMLTNCLTSDLKANYGPGSHLRTSICICDNYVTVSPMSLK